MKSNKLLSLLFFIFAFAAVAQAEAYVLNEGESNFSTIDEKVYTLSGEPRQLTFQAKCVAIRIWPVDYWGGDLKVAQKVNGNWERIFSKKPPRDSYEAYGPFNLKRNATHIKFYTETGATGKKYFKDIKVTMASYAEVDKSSIALGTTELGANKQGTFTVSHSNVNTLSVASSNNALFTPSVTTISGSGAGKHGTQAVTVTMNATTVGTHSGVIAVTNGTQTVNVNVSGTVTTKAQTLTWKANTDVVPVGEQLTDVATATSGLDVTYTSDNEAVLRVEDGKLVGVAAGTANVTARQAGDATWAAAESLTKVIEVTNKEVQTITWEQDFYRLKLGDAPVALTATSNSGLTMTYVSGNESVVSVTDGVLTVVGVGETTLTATQAGDMTYAAASYELPVRVREVSAGCDEYALYDPNGNYEVMDGWSGGHSKTFNLTAPADKLTLSTNNWSGVATGDVKVTEYYTDGSSKKIGNIGRNKRETFQLSRNAVKIVIGPDGGTLEKKIHNIVVTQATYLDASAPNVAFGKIEVGTTYSKTIDVNYSNLTDIVEVALKHNVFTLEGAAEFGSGCGDHGTQTYTVGIVPEQVGKHTDTLVVVSADRVLEIPLAADVQKKTQAIAWEQDLSSVQITDVIALTASSSAGLAIVYTSSDTGVALIDAENNLSFLAPGTATITAAQAGDGEYKAAQSMTKEVTVAKIVPTITVVPTASAITYGATLADVVLTGGEASVAGTFAWADATLVPNAGDGQRFQVVFTPENGTFYETVTADAVVNVAKVAQTITWDQELIAGVGETLYLMAISDAGLEVSYAIDNVEVASIEYGILTALASGTVNITASQPGNENVEAAESVVQVLVVKSPTATGVTSTATEALKLYPNPAVDYIVVATEAGDVLTVYDVQGRMMLHETTQEGSTTLNVQGLSLGKYIIVNRSAAGATRSEMFIKE